MRLPAHLEYKEEPDSKSKSSLQKHKQLSFALMQQMSTIKSNKSIFDKNNDPYSSMRATSYISKQSGNPFANAKRIRYMDLSKMTFGLPRVNFKKLNHQVNDNLRMSSMGNQRMV